jgi:phenylpropionate dioxygenase-like ring-hydroxylating dioxygenase large terminal subunit
VSGSVRKDKTFSRTVGCHYSFMHENLLDMNHQFLHRGIVGKIQPRLLGYDTGPHWRFTERVFAEDRIAVEAEQRAWDEQGQDRNHEVFPLILDLRDVLRTNGIPIRPQTAPCGAAALCGSPPRASTTPHTEPNQAD